MSRALHKINEYVNTIPVIFTELEKIELLTNDGVHQAILQIVHNLKKGHLFETTLFIFRLIPIIQQSILCSFPAGFLS